METKTLQFRQTPVSAQSEVDAFCKIFAGKKGNIYEIDTDNEDIINLAKKYEATNTPVYFKGFGMDTTVRIIRVVPVPYSEGDVIRRIVCEDY